MYYIYSYMNVLFELHVKVVDDIKIDFDNFLWRPAQSTLFQRFRKARAKNNILALVRLFYAGLKMPGWDTGMKVNCTCVVMCTAENEDRIM
jgi:hypothetical protein